MGCNIAYRKRVFNKIGGFNTKNFSDFHEDRELAIRAVKAGFIFESNPKAIVYHQKTYWSNKSLLKSAKAVSAWPKLKSLHPNHYLVFPAKFIKGGVLIHPEDYLYLIMYPIVVPVILVRYLHNGNRNLAIFIIKWPVFFIMRRYYIYKTSLAYKSMMF
jgi:GT2 family glycosyltransferase